MTHPEPEDPGPVPPDGAVLPRQVLVDASTLLEVSWVPEVRGLELLCQVQQDGNAAGANIRRSRPGPGGRSSDATHVVTFQSGRSLRLAERGLFLSG